jgi:DNA-binding NarL/FixJ family response regulator
VVVDDHKLVRTNTINLIKKALSALNINDCNIIEGSDGIDLLNIVRKDEKCKIKCILIDENMEYLNGSEAVKIIRKLEQNNKIKSQHIVSITAFDDIGTRKNILDSGVNTILSKPCTKSNIIEILRNVLS